MYFNTPSLTSIMYGNDSRCLKKALKTAPLTKKHRRELIIQAHRENPELSNREIGRRLKVNYEVVRQMRARMI